MVESSSRPLADFDRGEYDDRWARARDLMERSSLDGVVVTRQSNYRYLCGHRSVQFSIETRPLLLALPLLGDPILLVPRSELAEAAAQTWIADIRAYEGLTFSAESLASLLREAGLGRGRLGWELGPRQRLGLSYATFIAVRDLLPAGRFADGSSVLESLRLVKSPAELDRIRRACEIAARVYELVLGKVHIGLTVEECEGVVLEAMRRAGSDADARAIISFGSYARDHVYRRGDIFQLDFATSHRGYRADVTRRAVFGEPAERHRRDHADLVAVQEVVLGAIKAGAPANEVVAACGAKLVELGHAPIAGNGWIGHGLGLDLLEPPSLDLAEGSPLMPGMVLTPEPWFVSNGDWIMVEETVMVTAEGAITLAPPGFAYQELRTIPI